VPGARLADGGESGSPYFCFNKVALRAQMDLLFCGKATAVASVHRTLAKSRLSSPTESWDKIAKKNTTQ